MDEESLKHYNTLLIQANMTESRNPAETFDILEKCLTILQNNPDILTENPLGVEHHKSLIGERITYLRVLLDNRIESDITQPSNESIESLSEENAEPLSATPIEQIHKTPSSIYQSVFTRILNKEQLEYEEYLEFYQIVNATYPKGFPPIEYSSASLVYYVGDTHGAYEETLSMVRYFKKVLEIQPKTMIIFDGDYVDRNPLDLENLTLITAFHLMHPDSVKMLRGNHEDSNINTRYGFIQHIYELFEDRSKMEALYSEILTWFVKLPLANIMELPSSVSTKGSKKKSRKKTTPFRIFCCHAGIPVNNQDPYDPVSLGEIKALNTRHEKHEQFPQYMTWMLWADPREELEGIELYPNTGRDKFGEDVFTEFMKLNNLDLMVRGHEVLQQGYQYFFNNRLISLFSASNYNNRPIGNAKFARIQGPEQIDFLPTDSLDLDIDLAKMTSK